MEPSKKKLIVFAEDWGNIPSSSQHLIKALAGLGWQITWINSIGMRKPSLNWSYLKRLYQKLCLYLGVNQHQTIRSIPDNMNLINPFTIPIFGISLIDKINRFILQKQLYHAHKNLNNNPFLIWTALPTAYPYLSLFPNRPVIYYCGDDFSAFTNLETNKIVSLENKLIQRAQLIVVPSESLLKKMPTEKALLIDQGVDVALFEKKYHRPTDLPDGKPIAGFFGCLSSWVDIDLILECATKLQDWNFVLIGPKEVDISALQTLDNVFYLGMKPYAEIPAYAQHWNVGLLPFVKNQLTKACNPLKIKEYLMNGKPVVSITLPTLERFKPYIQLCNTSDEFIHAIPQTLDEPRALQSQRITWVKQFGWATQAQRLEKALLPLLQS